MKSSTRLVDLGRVLRSAGYSWQGLCAALQHEGAFRQELALFVVLAPVGLWLGDNAVERVLLVGVLLLVLVVELLNSALETLVDRVSTESHELSGRAKDMGSAAVLLSILAAVFTWILLLL
ncbi:MAG: diacylglycerol kinase [Gammaproteobacteria bacterium]|nr:diacylglycerol kinase [Gammaproteobacteria bacterium]